MKFCKNFKDIRLSDGPAVGGKNASLGQMIGDLSKKNITVPGGFAITADAYWYYLEQNGITQKLQAILKDLKSQKKDIDLKLLQKIGKKARMLLESATLPEELAAQITKLYQDLCTEVRQKNCSVAVRSSATAEDLPDASFAGQQESYLNICGVDSLLHAYKKCLASLFTNRAIAYRIEKGFDHFAVALSVGVQQMVRSDLACSGVMFTIDTESGFKNSVIITGSYGLGESVVQGEVVPDEFHVFKPTLLLGFDPIIKKECGSKATERVFGKTQKQPVLIKNVTKKRAQQYCLTDKEVVELARMAITIEDHYSQLKGGWCPMDIEWAKDGISGKLFIVQSRPETVHSLEIDTDQHVIKTYALKGAQKAKVLVTGQSIGQKIATGIARVVLSIDDMDCVQEGDILVTRMTDPDWVPVMKKAAAIITENGGRTCHAAIVSRELGIPSIVGATGALRTIKNGMSITVDCSTGSEGKVYDQELEVSVTTTVLSSLKKPKAKVNVNIAAPEYAYALSGLPVDGVGLARLEFIIANGVQVHPMVCADPSAITSKKILTKVHDLTRDYKTPADFFVHKVAQGVATIAAAFYPRPVLVRFSDFKSNEYRGLLGGELFEPYEENPMMGLRGASRYYHASYEAAFKLECKAMRYVRESMGFTNVNVMVPFVRTVPEAEKVVNLIAQQGLVSKKDGLQIYMMCELPSNVLLIEDFAKHFDGFSIGSNDLTQTTLSVDRDSGVLTALFDERDPAVMMMLKMAIVGAHKAKKPIGICGQAPSDYPAIAQFLIDCGIDSLSLNPDSVLPFLMRK
jgi:pyruvate,water dikinase